MINREAILRWLEVQHLHEMICGALVQIRRAIVSLSGATFRRSPRVSEACLLPRPKSLNEVHVEYVSECKRLQQPWLGDNVASGHWLCRLVVDAENAAVI